MAVTPITGTDNVAQPAQAASCSISATPNTERPRSLTSDALHGLKWTYLGTLVGAILQIGVTATMSRLLTPGVYGLTAAAGVFLRFGTYFSEMGIGQALVQKPVLSTNDIRAGFTASTGLGILVSGVMWLSAPLARHIMDHQDIVGVTRLLSVGLAINGAAATSSSLLRRNLRFRALSIIEVTSYLVSYAVLGIPLAFLGSGVWALTAVLISQPLLTLVLTYSAQRHSVRPLLRWDSHKALLSYGAKLSATSFAECLFFMAESSVVGRKWGDAALGLYNRATLLANLPASNASTALMKVLFPAFARAQGDNQRLVSAYLQGLAAMSLVSLPIAAGMMSAARDLILTLLGSQYHGGVGLVQILVFAMPLGMIASLGATVCNVKGEVGPRMRAQLLLSIAIWPAVILAAPFGLQRIAAVSIAVQVVRLAAFQTLAQRSMGLKWIDCWGAAKSGVYLAGLVWLAVHTAGWMLPSRFHFYRLVVEIAFAAVTYVGFVLWRTPDILAPLLLRALDLNPKLSRLTPFGWYRRRIAS
jgi:O-antigen/teichoic acid export membrane protein